MLAALSDYVFVWQLPLMLAFLAAWLIAGPFLARRALERHTELPRSKRRMGRCAQFSFLATGTGLLALLVVAGFFFAVGGKLQEKILFTALGAALAVPAMLAMSWAVGLSMLALPAKRVLRIVVTTTGPMAILLVVLGAGAAVPAWYARQDNLRRDQCRYKLVELDHALRMYAARGEEAPSLSSLVESKLLQPQGLVCPGRPDAEVGYLYLPSRSAPRRERQDIIRACDRRGNHGSKRVVLFTDGRVEFLSQGEFQDLLKRAENQELAKLVAAES